MSVTATSCPAGYVGTACNAAIVGSPGVAEGRELCVARRSDVEVSTLSNFVIVIAVVLAGRESHKKTRTAISIFFMFMTVFYLEGFNVLYRLPDGLVFISEW